MVTLPALTIPRLTPTRLRLLALGLIFLLSALVDIPTRIQLGSFSLSAMLTLFYALFAWLAWFSWFWVPNRVLLFTSPFLFLLVWGLFSFTWYQPNVPGFQNLSVIAAFIGLIFLTGQVFKRRPESVELLRNMVVISGTISALLYAASVILYGLESYAVFGARSFALYSFLSIAWLLAEWRQGKRASFLHAGVIVLVVSASLSRLAFVIAILLFPLAQFRIQKIKSWLITGIGGTLAVILLFFLVTNVEPIRARFFEGDLSFSIGNIPINVMGRVAFWTTTFDSYREAPFFGKGAGSAAELISTRYPGIDHPHSDYLRILHDYGLIGFLSWILGYTLLILATWKRWNQAVRYGLHSATLHHAAMLALIAIGLSMFTDNTLVYNFVMAPLGILTGASLGIRNHG